MRNQKEDILIYTTAEFLAKEDEFAQDGIEPYFEQSKRFYAGQTEAIKSELYGAITIHGLMLDDEEDQVTNRWFETKTVYADADNNQLAAASDTRNLDYYLDRGIPYHFDETRVEEVRKLVSPNLPLSVSLMRERIVNVNGFDVRVNFMYHDIMDHMWLFSFIRDTGIYEKHKDFLDSTGFPIGGFLFSRQSELISGIGFNTRRYLSNGAYFSQFTMDATGIVSLLEMAEDSDREKVSEAADTIESDKVLADCAGFVIKGTIASLLEQRRRWGAVKRIYWEDNTPSMSSEVVSLLDPNYIAFSVDTIRGLLRQKIEYTEAQKDLNLVIESLLQQFLSDGRALGNIALSDIADTNNLRSTTNDDILITGTGISTTYY